jgi:hypothetical protein
MREGQLESWSRMKSSRKRGPQILGVISKARAERLLTEWVNTDFPNEIGQNANAWERLFRRYPEIPSVPISKILPYSEADEPASAWNRFHQQMEMADGVAGYLQQAWEVPDLRSFEWYTWKAQAQYEWEAAEAKHNVTPSHVMEGHRDAENIARSTAAILKSEEPPATISPVEAAIFHLRQNYRRALCCSNPECPAPYFFATKLRQKYCSDACAIPAQREAKRRWWNENRAKGHKSK